MNSLYAFPSGSAEVPVVILSASPESQSDVGTVTLTAAVTGAYDSLTFTLERTDKNGASQSAPALSGSGLTRTFTPAARGDTYLATVEADFNGGANSVFASCVAGTTVEPALEWQLVCDIDFTQEPDQALSGGNLTLTNQVTGEPVVLAGQTVEVVGGALVMTAASSSNIVLGGASTRTAALLFSDVDNLWPDFDGEPLRWGAEVSAAPTFDGASRAWGVFAENAAGLSSGNSSYGYSAEIRSTGSGAATRQTRFQYGSTTNVSTVSSTAYAAGLVCGLSLEGLGSGGLWSLNAGDLDEMDVAAIVGAVGSPGNNFGGSPVQGVSRLGVFAASQLAVVFPVSITRLVLWARVPTVGP